MDTKLYFVALMLFCTASAITLQEIQKMKKDLDKELKTMMVETSVKKETERNRKDEPQDSQYNQFMKDVVKFDISDSLDALKHDYASEKIAADELKLLIKEEDKKEAKVFDQILKHSLKKTENKAHDSAHEAIYSKIDNDGDSMSSDEIDNAYKKLIELKHAGQDDKASVLSKKEALKDFKDMALKDASQGASDIIGSNNCHDKRKDCLRLKKANLCEIPEYRKNMRYYCAYTCEACFRCEDKWGRKKCNSLQKYCKVKKGGIRTRMKRNCHVTCGYCKQRSPPACQSKEFGCCWDNSTAKKDPLGTNCPVCEDQYKNLCESFKQLCYPSDDSSPGKYIKKHCPKKCGFCGAKTVGNCKDRDGYHSHCRKWKNIGLCEFKDVSNDYCKGTCNKKCGNHIKTINNII